MTESTEPRPERNLLEEFKRMPAADKLLAAASAAALLGFVILGNWGALFKDGWFHTCAFLGSVGVLVLLGVELVGMKLLEGAARTYVLILLAILPVLGFVIDALHDFWRAVMLAGAIVMGFAGVKITTREKIIRR
jgi:hypothetical protein